ncbi:MAG: glycosyltransferase family 2 protein [Candidatus Cloacimonetes bacterium]|nr:glycosyltransferase family 2 protein [Candidatus Cloacimonadota bacterium]
MDNLPLISCITPTFNRSSLIREAIESNLAQIYPNWEMLIIDDQSTDDTWQVINDYAEKDARIRCFKNPLKGANNARNLGIEQAKGKYLVFLDDDDVNLPHRFKSQVECLQKSGSRFILTGFEIRDRSNKLYKKTNRKILQGIAAHFLVRWMIEKTLIQEAGCFDPEMMSMQEIELSYRIATLYTFDQQDDVVVKVYNTHDSISKGISGIKGKLKLIDKAGHLMPAEEKASWYYAIALNSLRINRIDDALHYFGKATDLSKQLKKHERVFRAVAILSVKLKAGLWSSRLLARTFKQKFSEIVNHRVIQC